MSQAQEIEYISTKEQGWNPVFTQCNRFAKGISSANETVVHSADIY